MFGTDNGIALPVSQTGFAGDNGRRGSDRVRRSYRRACYSVFRAVVDAPQVAAVAFVLPYHLIDAFMGLSLMPCSHSRPLICSGNQRIWHNFASILRRNGAISLRGLLRIACRA